MSGAAAAISSLAASRRHQEEMEKKKQEDHLRFMKELEAKKPFRSKFFPTGDLI